MASQGNFSIQNRNGHIHLAEIDRVDNVIHGSSKALANST